MELSSHDLKKLMIIPVILLVVSMIIVTTTAQKNAIPMGIDLKGGTLITIYSPLEKEQIATALAPKFDDDLSIDTISDISGVVGYTVQLDAFLSVEEKEDLQNSIIAMGVAKDAISIRDAQASISFKTLKEGVKAVFFALIFMAVVVFIRFRTFVPSFAVVISAFSDIVITLAIMILLGIPLTAGSLVALLLLIGYSVDTDILLTTRVLVRKVGTFEKRLWRAMKTGLTMAATTLSAIGILYVASTSVVLKEIAVVILIGLVVDLMNTWIQNARILQWHLERG
ncbi:MAG: protein translocase subunit SecF [Candidatus Hydrothermarchaeota archaeon]|nr:protein translocase subunit SecF [Candidatus Hydrothermarchaeota archaeon]